MAAALRKQEFVEEVVRILEFYPEAVEALDEAPRPANVAAMVEEIRRMTERLLTLLSSGGAVSKLTAPSGHEDSPWPEDDILAIQHALTLALFPIRTVAGTPGVIATGDLIGALDDADTFSLNLLCRALRASGGQVLRAGDLLEPPLQHLSDACRAVARDQDQVESRGRPAKEARQLVIHQLDELFRLHARDVSRGRSSFIAESLSAAEIKLPSSAEKLQRLLPRWNVR